MTTTSQSLKLRRKSGKTLDLTSAPYAIGRNFIVPSVSPIESIAYGSSANTYGGGVLSSVKYNDRTWAFEIRILSTTEASVRLAARRVDDFIKNDPLDTLYIDYRPSTDTPEPLWGQYGAAFEYEVVSASRVELYDDYADGLLRTLASFITINVVIKPFAHGRQQLACTSTGGITESRIGSTDQRALGTIIPEATTNKMTNPVLGHATFGNGWTAGAVILAAQNTDQRYIFPGAQFSGKLIRTAAGGAGDNNYTQSIAAGNTNKHSLGAIVKLQGGGAITSTEITAVIPIGSTAVTAQSLGDGWYWIKCENFDGTVGASNIGVRVATYEPIYLAAIQYEEKAYCTWPAWGDLPGCAWTGTAHASTSTRTAASCKLSNSTSTFNESQGSIRVVVRFDVPNTHGTSMVIFDARDGTHASAPVIYFETSTDTINFSVGGVILASSALTFSAGQTYVIHATYASSGYALYLNGASVDTDTFTYSTTAAYLFIGSSYSNGNQVVGLVDDIATFDRALTSTQVSNDYANIAAVLARGESIGSIPWFWTIGGDGVLSLTSSHQPLGLVAGVPGSAPAVTEIQGTLSSNLSTIKSLALSSYPCDLYLGIGPFLYDYSGAAEGADPEYGDAHKTTTVNGVDIVLSPANPVLASFIADQINGMEYVILARLYGSAATAFNLYSAWSNSSSNVSSDTRSITPAVTYLMFHTKTNKVGFDTKDFTGVSSTQISHYIYGSKIATNVDISVDYIAVLPRPFVFISGGNQATTTFVIKGFSAYHTSSGFNSLPLITTGDKIELAPNKMNHIQAYICTDETVNPLISYTTTINAIYITPRWALL